MGDLSEMVSGGSIHPLKNNTYPRVLVSSDGDALFFEGPTSVLFISAADIDRWTDAPTRTLMAPISGALRISVLTVLLEAGAQFVGLSESRPPSALHNGLCLDFETASGLRVTCVDDDRIVIIDHTWFERRGCHLLVGPTIYHASKQSAPVNDVPSSDRNFTPALIEARLQRAQALQQLFIKL